MYTNIQQHGNNLITLFRIKNTHPIELCKKLRALENTTHRAATKFCNGELSEQQWNRASDYVRDQLSNLFGPAWLPIIKINSDPRGYALKIDSDFMRIQSVSLYRDFGGYGILAPDFTP
jgi:hypothetical protein